MRSNKTCASSSNTTEKQVVNPNPIPHKDLQISAKTLPTYL
ncbi:MAG: hypothetical protein AB8C13_01405 [Phycisphaerales bacterium]